jgi:hypothetical protein
MIETLILLVFVGLGLALLAMVVGVFQLFFLLLKGLLWVLKIAIKLPVMIVAFALGMVLVFFKGLLLLGLVLAVAAVIALSRRGRGRRRQEEDALARLHRHLGGMERRMRRMEDDPRIAEWEHRPRHT